MDLRDEYLLDQQRPECWIELSGNHGDRKCGIECEFAASKPSECFGRRFGAGERE
jgi:hypothetical protein